MAFFGKKAESKPETRGSEPEIVTPSLPAPHRRYGIDDTIQLMRTLPLNQNTELILLVIRNTLASIEVELKEVIDDGTAKQERLRKEIASVEAAIAELERETNARKQELDALNTDLSETTTAKERLELAAKQTAAIALPSVATTSQKPSYPAPSPRAPKPPSRAPQAQTATGPGEDRTSSEIEPLPDSPFGRTP
jgi:cell division protein FtsB